MKLALTSLVFSLIQVYDSDDGSSYCEDDESWGSGWEEDFGEEEPPPIPKDPILPPPIPRDPTPPPDVKKEPKPITLTKEVIPPPQIVVQEPNPQPQVISIQKQDPKEVTTPQIKASESSTSKEDAKSKEVDQSKQIRATAHLSGFESSKAVPTPLMKFSTHHVSIPSSFGKTKSGKSSSDKNKHHLKVDVKKEVVDEAKPVPVKKEENFKETEPVITTQADQAAKVQVFNKIEEIPKLIEEPKRELGTKQKSPKVEIKSSSQKKSDTKSSQTKTVSNDSNPESKSSFTNESPSFRAVANATASKKVESEIPIEQYLPISNKYEANKDTESQKSPIFNLSTSWNITDSSNIDPKVDTVTKLEEPKIVVQTIKEKDSYFSSSKSSLTESTNKSSQLSTPSSPRRVASSPSLTPTTLQQPPPSPKPLASSPSMTRKASQQPPTSPKPVASSPTLTPKTLQQLPPSPKPVASSLSLTPNKLQPPPQSPKTVASSPLLTRKRMQPPPPSPEPRSGFFKDSNSMHRTESFPRADEIRSTKLADKIVSAPPFESMSNIFSFKEVKTPEPKSPTRPELDVKPISSPVQATPTAPTAPTAPTTPTPTSYKAPLLKIKEEQIVLPIVEVSTPKYIPTLLPKDIPTLLPKEVETPLPEEVKTLLPDETANEYRSILLPELEKECLNRSQKNGSPPKHVHFEKPQTPSPVAEATVPVFKTSPQVPAHTQPRVRRTRPSTVLQQQAYQVSFYWILFFH